METSNKPAEVHPEDRELISRLARLQDMHEQVLDLRSLLPQRLWNPILATIKAPRESQATRSPSALFNHLQKTADDGCREVETFKVAWHNSEMQDLLGQTRTAGFPQGTDTWKVDYRTQVVGTREQEKSLPSSAEQSATIGEDPKDVIDRFKKIHPRIKLDLSDEETLWPLILMVAGMSFEVDRQAADGANAYRITAKAGKRLSNLQQEIITVVQQRKAQDSLAYLLEMLASYDGITTRACDKCLKIIDDSLQFAVAREEKTTTDSDNGAETTWLAYHRKCA